MMTFVVASGVPVAQLPATNQSALVAPVQQSSPAGQAAQASGDFAMTKSAVEAISSGHRDDRFDEPLVKTTNSRTINQSFPQRPPRARSPGPEVTHAIFFVSAELSFCADVS